MSRYKISIYSIISYALFFAVFKPYFLPTTLRQVLKIAILVGTLLFIMFNSEQKRLLNCTLIFGFCVLLSAVAASINGNYNIRDVFDSILYALTFYDLYTFAGLCNYKGNSDKLIKCMYRMNSIYCILTVVSVALVGVENNSNDAAYLFGNKFISAYLFILLIALYGASHEMRKKINGVILSVIFIFSILFSLYIGCSTAVVTLVVLFAVYLLPDKMKQQLINGKYVIIALILSALIVMWIKEVLKINFVHRIVFDYFGKSYTVMGRLEIYSKYLVNVILDSFWVGHGYSNTIMKDLTGVYANAQNGLLDMFISFGFLGVIALIFTVYYCYKQGWKGNKTFYLSLVVYGMIIAAIFEIALNWFFLLGLCLIRWNCSTNKL
ncbi:hypothetical protein RZO55_19505 [Clostridium boliviensis]|uniref:O-antigen ligase-related domain-containing protein n=1 Tax=Clostridium boliviensis TaxID=318465 RepID=A0ABU4GQ67_9CLOT|nr:O-antigen ligase family protein [Clostridium boliviensis]MDW2799765.1 hypothetical protein [Clostridium boliviensis]